MKPHMTKCEALGEIYAKVAAGTLSQKSADYRREQLRRIARTRNQRDWEQQQRLYAIWAG